MKNIALDFTNVESRELLPEGEYAVEVKEIEQREGNKGPYLNWELQVCAGQFKGRKIWNVTSLAVQSLWVLRATLEALGVQVPGGKFILQPDAYKGLKMGVRLVHRVHDSKTRAKVESVFPLVNEVTTEDEEPAKIIDPDDTEET